MVHRPMLAEIRPHQGEQKQGKQGAKRIRQHILLRITDVALRANQLVEPVEGDVGESMVPANRMQEKPESHQGIGCVAETEATITDHEPILGRTKILTCCVPGHIA